MIKNNSKQFDREVAEIANGPEMIAVQAVLPYIYSKILEFGPRVIVQLGVGVNGLASRVIWRAAYLVGASYIGVDLKDCSKNEAAVYGEWFFAQADAREFHARFENVCSFLGIRPVIDLLYIDLDEKYKTTKLVWENWKRFLSERCMVMFRCSNLQKTIFWQDGSVNQRGWDNDRGVIRVIQEELGIFWDENEVWDGRAKGWKINHLPWGAGLTVLTRES